MFGVVSDVLQFKDWCIRVISFAYKLAFPWQIFGSRFIFMFLFSILTFNYYPRT